MLHPGLPMADKVALGWEGPARVVTRCSNASRRCWHAARCHGAICTSRLARPRCCSHAARLAAIGSASVNAQHSLGSGGDGAAGAAAKAMPSSLCATGAQCGCARCHPRGRHQLCAGGEPLWSSNGPSGASMPLQPRRSSTRTGSCALTVCHCYTQPMGGCTLLPDPAGIPCWCAMLFGVPLGGSCDASAAGCARGQRSILRSSHTSGPVTPGGEGRV